MSVLNQKQRKEWADQARSDTLSLWAWGDKAVQVAGVPGENQANDESQAKLAGALVEVVESHSDLTIRDLPTVDRLGQYRLAAAAIPPELRKTVRSIEAGRELWQVSQDVGDRHRVIEALKNDKGIVTLDAVREFRDKKDSHGNAPDPPPVIQKKAKQAKTTPEKEASQRIKDAKVKASTAAAEGKTLSAHVWRIVGKVDDWRRDMAAIREELADLSADEKQRVAATYRALRDEVEAGLAVLEGTVADDDVIDGRGREVRLAALNA
jgi:hypothetical protein